MEALLIALLAVVLLAFLWMEWLLIGMSKILDEMAERFRQAEEKIRRATRRLGG
jgi:hypothetical protein